MCHIEAHRVVRAHLGVSDSLLLVDKVSGRHRQLPESVSIEFCQIHSELQIDFP